MYTRVNVELGMRRGELLQAMASENWSEYFIGIGKDQSEVFRAKSRLAELDPQNASAFWGDERKLLPSITDGSIDNFMFVLPASHLPSTPEERASMHQMLSTLGKKLVKNGGKIKILTDAGKADDAFKRFIEVAEQAGFSEVKDESAEGKRYFPKEWTDREFTAKPRVVTLAPK
jgi:tRNA G46 methylase TrmB